MADRIQVRRDTDADWTSNDPTLAAGELGYVSDTDEIVVGDGSTAYSSLNRFGNRFGMETATDATNTAVSTTANSTIHTLSFADPGGAVRVMVTGYASAYLATTTNEEIRLRVVIDGTGPGREARANLVGSSRVSSLSQTFGREWTPAGAFSVTLELWDNSGSGNMVSTATGVTAVLVPA